MSFLVDTNILLRSIDFPLLLDFPAIYPEWERLVSAYAVRSVNW
jgi:hypothetical protein